MFLWSIPCIPPVSVAGVFGAWLWFWEVAEQAVSNPPVAVAVVLARKASATNKLVLKEIGCIDFRFVQDLLENFSLLLKSNAL
jgi:hypothetical protein